MGIGGRKVYVDSEHPPLELKIYRSDLEHHLGSPLEVAGFGAALVGPKGRLLLGQAVRLRVKRYDEQRRRWCFEILESTW